MRPASMVLALALSFLSGFVALSHEILWYRVYSYASQGSAHAFALMLGAYLVGIALGSLASRALCRDGEAESSALPLRAVSWLLAASALAFFVPPALAWVVRWSDAWQLGLPLVVLSAGLLGAVFPLVSHASFPADARAGARISYLYLANILGSTLGSLGTGFWLLDHWPLSRVALFLALLSLAAAALLALARQARGRAFAGQAAGQVAVFAAAAIALVALTPALYATLYERLQFKSGYREGETFAHVIENKSGVIAVARDGTIYGGGAYDGGFNTSLRNDANGIVRAYAFAELHRKPREVLMIGLSSGSWAAVIADHPGIERLTVVEINPGYLELLPHYPQVAGLASHPKVRIEIDDGRRWLVRNAQRKFDAIVFNTTLHWRAHVSNLLSVEFLQLLRSRLNEGGVIYFNTTGSNRVLRTATAVFPHTLRVAYFVAASDRPLNFDVERWQGELLRYSVAGERVLDVRSAEDRRVLANLGERMRNELLEHDASLRARTAGLEPITDDNMGSEWDQ